MPLAESGVGVFPLKKEYSAIQFQVSEPLGESIVLQLVPPMVKFGHDVFFLEPA